MIQKHFSQKCYAYSKSNFSNILVTNSKIYLK